jgi:hypothetical protein
LLFRGAGSLEIDQLAPLLFSNFPSLLDDTDIGSEHDAFQSIANQGEVLHRDLANQHAGVLIEIVE